MRAWLSLLFASVVLFPETVSGHDPSDAIAALVKELTTASQAQDLALVQACYETRGASDEAVDQALYLWQENFNLNGDNSHWSFAGVSYRPLEEIKADKTMNLSAMLSMLGPVRMGLHSYGPNLKIIGFVTVHFKQGMGETGMMLPVGLEDETSARIALSVRQP